MDILLSSFVKKHINNLDKIRNTKVLDHCPELTPLFG